MARARCTPRATLRSWSNGVAEERVVGKTRGSIADLVVVAGTAALLLVAGSARAQSEAVLNSLANILDRVITVEPGEDTLHEAVEEAEPGDTLVLEPGLYVLTHTVLIEKDLTIQGATGKREDVHIVGVREDFDFEPEIFGEELEDLPNWGHLLFIRSPAQKVVLQYFTIKGAPEIEALDELTCEAVFHLNHSECMGDAIHADGVAVVEIDHVEASLNAGNGIWIDGAERAVLRKILGVNNGAFGIDGETALDLQIREGTFTANQVSGIEASGHELGTPKDQYVAKVSVKKVVAKGNSEIGVEVERFSRATIEDVVCQDNREDGFDADRVVTVKVKDSKFINNMDDGMELFPVDVVPAEQPADFPGSIVEDYKNLDFSGNVGEEINHAPTEN